MQELEVPSNLTVEEAQAAINTASQLKASGTTIVEGATKVAHGVVGIFAGAKEGVVSAAKTLVGR